jgi:hypothetical protein
MSYHKLELGMNRQTDAKTAADKHAFIVRESPSRQAEGSHGI